VKKAFQLFDDKGKNYIEFEDLKRVARELGESLTEEELKDMIKEADREGKGKVTLEDFIEIITKSGL